MKKTILAVFIFAATPFAHAQVADSDFLDNMENRAVRNENLSVRDAFRLLDLSSEAPRMQRRTGVVEEAEEAITSSEDPATQPIAKPTYSRARRSFAHVTVPQKIQPERYFELSDRNFDTSLNMVRERQKRAVEKALRYRNLFR